MVLSDAGVETVKEMAALLRERLEESGLKPGSALSVDELQKTVLPYAACRGRLELATKAEYDLALLRLLFDGDVVSIGEERLAKAVEKELASPEPELGFLSAFANSQLEVRPEEAGTASGTGVPAGRGGRKRKKKPSGRRAAVGKGAAPAEKTAAGEPETAGEAETAVGEPETEAAGEPETEAAGEEPAAQAMEESRCWECDAVLPDRPNLRYCPFCGTDQTIRRCRECGDTLELTWRFCPVCGTQVPE